MILQVRMCSPSEKGVCYDYETSRLIQLTTISGKHKITKNRRNFRYSDSRKEKPSIHIGQQRVREGGHPPHTGGTQAHPDA